MQTYQCRDCVWNPEPCPVAEEEAAEGEEEKEEEEAEEDEEDMLREKSNNPNLKGGEQWERNGSTKTVKNFSH